MFLRRRTTKIPLASVFPLRMSLRWRGQKATREVEREIRPYESLLVNTRAFHLKIFSCFIDGRQIVPRFCFISNKYTLNIR